MYKSTQNPNQIIRLSDGAIIPNAPNGDWGQFQLWLGDGNTPEAADIIPPAIREIDRRRLKLALHQLGVLDTVNTAINSLGIEAQINWEEAQFIREDHPLSIALAANLGLDVDAIFDLAESLD